MNIVTRIFAMILLLGLSGLAGAQTAVTINASNAPYNSVNALRGVGIGSEFEIRNAALTAAAGAYRAQFGTSAMTKLKVNEQFKVKYQDGTSETAKVVSQTSSLGSVPVPGTQRDANGNLISGTGGTGGSGGGGGTSPTYGIIGYRPIYMTGTVCAAGVCQTQTVLVGYEPIYGYIYEQ